MQAIFFVGLQAFASGRYSVAYNAAMVLISIENKGPIKFILFFKYIKSHTKNFQFVNELCANFFIPSQLENNISEYIDFIMCF